MFTFFAVLACATLVWAVYLLTRVKYAQVDEYFNEKYSYLSGGIFIFILGLIWYAIAMSVRNEAQKYKWNYNYEYIQDNDTVVSTTVYEDDGL